MASAMKRTMTESALMLTRKHTTPSAAIAAMVSSTSCSSRKRRGRINSMTVAMPQGIALSKPLSEPVAPNPLMTVGSQ